MGCGPAAWYDTREAQQTRPEHRAGAGHGSGGADVGPSTGARGIGLHELQKASLGVW